MGLDHIGRLTIYHLDRTLTLLPLLEGSQLLLDPALESEPLASNLGGPVNFTQQLNQPLLQVNALPLSNWFHRNNLQVLFTYRDVWGQLANWGAVRWQYTDGEPLYWTGCKCRRMVVTFGQGGDPLGVSLLLAPYGSRRFAGTESRVPAAGQPLASQHLTFTGLSEVLGGSLLLENPLEPDFSWPRYASIDGAPYPRDYYTGALTLEVQLSQWATARDYWDPPYQVHTEPNFALHVWHPTRQERLVSFNLNTLHPTRTERVTLGPAVLQRRYQGIRASRASLPLILT